MPSIHQALSEKEVLPQHHLVDMSYTSARLIVSSQQEYDIDLFGLVAINAQWQAKEEAGFDLFHDPLIPLFIANGAKSS